MKRHYSFLLFSILLSPFMFSYNVKDEAIESVYFKLRGTGSKSIDVVIGVGSAPGKGACCTSICYNCSYGVKAAIGDVVYDDKTKRVLIKVYKELDGKTIDLKEYY